MAMLENGAGRLFDPDIVARWKRIHLDVTGEDSKENTPAYRPNAYSDIEKAASEVHFLDTLSEEISGLSSVQEIALEAIGMLEKHIPPSRAVLWPVDGDQLVSHSKSEEQTAILQFGSGVSGWVAAEQSPCVNLTVDAGLFEGKLILAVPVLFDGRVLAVLSVYRDAKFGDDEIRQVTAAAERIAGGLHKTRMIEIANQDAISDQFTGLANRRALERAFEDSSAEPFPIVLLDLDSFKAFNDSFGHRAGNEVLVRLASHLQSVFLSTDTICRIGADEFLIASQGSAFAVRRAVREFQRRVTEDSKLECYRELEFGVSWGYRNLT
jgi:diguanylate cyclase (GGDEF)-like protein